MNNLVDIYSPNSGTNIFSVSGINDSKIKRLKKNYKNIVLPLNLCINKIYVQDFNEYNMRYIYYHEKSIVTSIQNLILSLIDIYPIRINSTLIDSKFMNLESIKQINLDNNLIIY